MTTTNTTISIIMSYHYCLVILLTFSSIISCCESFQYHHHNHKNNNIILSVTSPLRTDLLMESSSSSPSSPPVQRVRPTQPRMKSVRKNPKKLISIEGIINGTTLGEVEIRGEDTRIRVDKLPVQRVMPTQPRTKPVRKISIKDIMNDTTLGGEAEIREDSRLRVDNFKNSFTPRYQQMSNDFAERAAATPKKERKIESSDIAKQKAVSERITELLNENLENEDDTSIIADRQTVFAKLPDEDKRMVSAVVSKSNEFSGDETKKTTQKSRVKATVSETGRDTINQYVKSLSDHQVLGLEDEQILGRQIQILQQWEVKRQGLEMQLERPPTFVEWADCLNTTESELKKQVRRSKKAKAALVESSLRQVVYIARQTMKKGIGIDFREACQDGIIGLGNAADRFDPSRGFRFSTYAQWHIRKEVQQNCVEQVRGPIRLPDNVMKDANNIRVNNLLLKEKLYRWPTNKELADESGLSLQRLNVIQQATDKQRFISLEANLENPAKRESKESKQTALSEILIDKSADHNGNDGVMEKMDQQMLKADVRALIETLRPKEQAVIRLRFGLGKNSSPASKKDIAKKFNVSEHIISKIEERAFEKLRHPYRSKFVEVHVPDL